MYTRIGIVLLFVLGMVPNVAMASRALPYLSLYHDIRGEHWPDMPMPHLPCGQVEQESSWRERATLSTSRELGRGLVQLTIAYRADGAERFNSYREAVAKFRALREWDWQRDPYNVRYQLTYLVLQDRSNYRLMRPMMIDEVETWKAALVCYNAGPGRVLLRRGIAQARESPVDRWTGGLDSAHGPKEAVLIYGRPLWQAVNEYPLKVFQRAAKYQRYCQ